MTKEGVGEENKKKEELEHNINDSLGFEESDLIFANLFRRNAYMTRYESHQCFFV